MGQVGSLQPGSLHSAMAHRDPPPAALLAELTAVMKLAAAESRPGPGGLKAGLVGS